MSDLSVLDKYVKGKDRPNGEVSAADENDETDDMGAFGWLRGVRERSLMLEFRHKDGTVTSLGYAWLERAKFDPSVGITLKFTGTTVKIIGLNLNAERRQNVRLFAGLIRHRVPWIQVADGAEQMEAAKDATLIQAIRLV